MNHNSLGCKQPYKKYHTNLDVKGESNPWPPVHVYYFYSSGTQGNHMQYGEFSYILVYMCICTLPVLTNIHVHVCTYMYLYVHKYTTWHDWIHYIYTCIYTYIYFDEWVASWLQETLWSPCVWWCSSHRPLLFEYCDRFMALSRFCSGDWLYACYSPYFYRYCYAYDCVFAVLLVRFIFSVR